ncbi:hypothetical protein [Novosphingobium sp. FKTRR1]|uniref:hypothetical protein n=1 Tax=Novosphingobium sp. FKTRR1 TaxID=2879118 RepID=UPI001CF0ACAB|nr:hypothetical protein [Novosphingobium sp. FKTRR1]
MADIVTSQTRIANRALILLGTVTRVISVDDPAPLARQIKDLWHESRRAAIISHPWNFALFRAELNETGDAPAFGYTRRFAIPPEALRWLPPPRDSDWFFEGVEEGGHILTDASAPLPFRGIQDIEDVGAWPAHFQAFMAYQLAMDLADAATQFSAKAQDMAQMREAALEEAKKLDGLASGERTTGNARYLSRWARSRRERSTNSFSFPTGY